MSIGLSLKSHVPKSTVLLLHKLSHILSPQPTRQPGPSLEVECAGVELLGVAVGFPVPFPEPEADAIKPISRVREDPGALFGVGLGWVAWVGRGVGDPLQNCCR